MAIVNFRCGHLSVEDEKAKKRRKKEGWAVLEGVNNNCSMANVATFRESSAARDPIATFKMTEDGSYRSKHDQSTPPSASTSGSTPLLSSMPSFSHMPLPSMVGTTVDKDFDLLAYVGQCGGNWNHYTAQSKLTKKVSHHFIL